MNVASTSGFVLEARGLSKTYVQGKLWQKKRYCHALDDITIALRPAATLALVGESGCGKTTLAKCLVGLEAIDRGQILLAGVDISINNTKPLTPARKKIQLIFQDSSSAISPRMSAIEIVEEPLLISGGYSRSERRALAEEMMENVGIPAVWKQRTSREFSGGQRQRLAIARALVLDPQILVLDEVFVGMDLSIKGQIANLLLDLQQSRGLSYLCISHDLSIARKIADTVAVMDRGRIVRQGNPRDVLADGKLIMQDRLFALQFEEASCSARSGA